MEEDHSTLSSHTLLHMAAGLLPMAAAPLSLLLFTFSHTCTSLTFCSHIMPLFIGISWQLFLLCCQHWWLPNSSSFNNGGCQPLTSRMGAHGRYNSNCSCCHCQWLLHINGNQPNRMVMILTGIHYDQAGGAVNVVAPGYSKGTALGAEIIGTFVLVYTVLAATDPKRMARDSHVPVLAPLPIGFAVFVVHLALIPITGTGINPARSLGAAVVKNAKEIWDDHWIFWVGPFVGALAAAVYHQYILGSGAAKALASFRSNPTS